MIKAIETQYRGYRFRSRLEARWAVFFDIYLVALKFGLNASPEITAPLLSPSSHSPALLA